MYFEGIYQLYFRKAKACWWMGKSDEARKIYRFVLDNFIEELRPEYKTLLEQNLSSLGGGPEYLSFKEYTKSLKEKFKFPFEGLDSIEKISLRYIKTCLFLLFLKGK